MTRLIRHVRRVSVDVLVALVTALTILTGLPLIAQRGRLTPEEDADRQTAIPRGSVDPLAPQAMAARVGAFLEADRRGLRYLPGEVAVRFKTGTSSAGQQRALGALRSRPSREELRWVGDFALLRDALQPDATILARQLSEQPEVLYAQPNYIRRQPASVSRRTFPLQVAAHPLLTPNDPDFLALQWNFSLLDLPAAWNIIPGGRSTVTVAVIDSGITSAKQSITVPLWTGFEFEPIALDFDVNPDLPASRLVKSRDFTFPLLTPDAAAFDLLGHGTHVASTIAEEANNGIGLAGMAFKVRIMPVKVCVGYWDLMIASAALGTSGFVAPVAGGCDDADIAAGIRYAADNGANVINVSLGGPETAPVLREALLYAVSKGVFVAIAAGNDFDIGNEPNFPAAYAAEIDGVISVGAIGKSQKRARYSNTTSQTEIAAPGGDPEAERGDDGYIWQSTLLGADQSPLLRQPRFDRYADGGYAGTSMATPHVSALAALLISEGVTSPKMIEAVIKATAKDLGKPGRDEEFGYGLIQPRAALYGQGITK